MKITITVRHINDQKQSESLRQYILKRVKRFNRYINPGKDPSELRFVLSVEKFRNSVEVILTSGNFKATSSVNSEAMHLAIDKSINSIIKQLKKQTDKKIKTKRRESIKIKPALISDQPTENTEAGTIRIRKLPKKPMSVEEALLQLNVSLFGFVAFTNSETGAMNILHKTKGGTIELITP
jgi:putative sigma-54 modulation protein